MGCFWGKSIKNASVAASSRCKTLQDVASFIIAGKVKNIVWLSGAGISASAGIPDFRTPGTGLYDNLSKYNLPYPEAVFDLAFFKKNPLPFYRLSRELLPGSYQPTLTHTFIQLLYKKNILLRSWTQNIDGLERVVGIPEKKLVEAHGTFATSRCISCIFFFFFYIFKKYIMKRYILSLRSETSTVPQCKSCRGLPKPDIVFFGESLPKKFYKNQKDFEKCDLLIVAGTSLEVQPFCSLPGKVKNSVPRLLMYVFIVRVRVICPFFFYFILFFFFLN
eukprot:GSMAST32.ASY1.ANO1.1082.1 assembled CDS